MRKPLYGEKKAAIRVNLKLQIAAMEEIIKNTKSKRRTRGSNWRSSRRLCLTQKRAYQVAMIKEVEANKKKEGGKATSRARSGRETSRNGSKNARARVKQPFKSIIQSSFQHLNITTTLQKQWAQLNGEDTLAIEKRAIEGKIKLQSEYLKELQEKSKVNKAINKDIINEQQQVLQQLQDQLAITNATINKNLQDTTAKATGGRAQKIRWIASYSVSKVSKRSMRGD